MDRKPRPGRHSRQLHAVALLAGLVLVTAVVTGQNPPQTLPLDPTKELALKITAPFTLTAVGDIMEMHAGVAQIADPATQGAMKLIRDADLSFANMETNIADIPNFEGAMGGLIGPKEVAADVKAMGFRILNRGNNVAMSSGPEGMLSTNNLLDAVGIAHAGAGKNLQEAREVGYVETPKGRVGMVGALAGGGGAATARFGNLGGAAGINPIRLARANIVTAEHLEALRKIRDAVYATRSKVTHPVPPLPANEPADQLTLFGETYKVGSTPGAYTYTMDRNDLQAYLRSVRNGKQYADFMIATVHSLESPTAVELGNVSEYPADFLIELAHKAIDNGADAFLGHGVHVLRGVEIYKGKPIFYGLHAFVYQLQQELAGLERYGDENPYKTESTEADLEWKFYASYSRPRMSEDNLESVVAESRYDRGRLVEVRLHPLDLGVSAPMSQKGTPRIASPEVSQRILQRLQTISKPFGTAIAIEGNVGVIRVPTSTSSSAR